MQIKKHLLRCLLALVLALLLSFVSLPAAALALPRQKLPEKDKTPMTLPAASSAPALIPGGMPFGVRVQTKGVMVVGLTELTSGGKTCRPAYEGGVREQDILVEINQKPVADAEEATSLITAAAGQPLNLTLLRSGARVDVTVTPKKCDKDGVFRLGLYLRDSVSGIGTVTFIEPKSGIFGGLGHGVCDSSTGALVPLLRGSVLSVRIAGVERGAVGDPGELRGAIGAKRMGALVTNSECGVFGVLSDPPTDKEALPVCPANEVKEGEATLLCTLGDDGVCAYRVEISHIEHGNRPTKSFTVRVTDPKLLERTGGIVQGMSGSPLIQEGRLVGAVTHVLVDDPTAGYGIFIENMLSASQLKPAA